MSKLQSYPVKGAPFPSLLLNYPNRLYYVPGVLQFLYKQLQRLP